MLFQKKHQKKIQLIWKIIVIVMILGMIALYMPGIFY
jgi:hypothetical protein